MKSTFWTDEAALEGLKCPTGWKAQQQTGGPAGERILFCGAGSHEKCQMSTPGDTWSSRDY